MYFYLCNTATLLFMPERYRSNASDLDCFDFVWQQFFSSTTASNYSNTLVLALKSMCPNYTAVSHWVPLNNKCHVASYSTAHALG